MSAIRLNHVFNTRKKRDFMGQATDEVRVARQKAQQNKATVNLDDPRYAAMLAVVKDIITSLKSACPNKSTGYFDVEGKIILDWKQQSFGWEAGLEAMCYPPKILLKTAPMPGKNRK